MDELIFQMLSYVGLVTSLGCGVGLLISLLKREWSRNIHVNLLILGIVYLLAGVMFGLAVFKVDGFALMSPFAKGMRPLIIIMEIIPAMMFLRLKV
jgi:hypothetical protein